MILLASKTVVQFRQEVSILTLIMVICASYNHHDHHNHVLASTEFAAFGPADDAKKQEFQQQLPVSAALLCKACAAACAAPSQAFSMDDGSHHYRRARTQETADRHVSCPLCTVQTTTVILHACRQCKCVRTHKVN